MPSKINILYSIFAFMVLARIFAMFSIPLTDTTEARYAHTALIMATSGDWITPYYDLGFAFWGKPPFSFWAQALSIKIFGVHDFSARFPALIFTLMTMGLLYTYVKRFHSQQTAIWASLIYFSFLLTYALSGAILTDPFLSFATTLSMISFAMVLKNQEKYWGYLFFVGFAVGILAKGPLTIVLIGGATLFWILFDFKERFMKLGKLPWLGGILLILITSIPWYIIAELKTPGFLDYFIVGEHYKRFVDSGWSGDLYGVAHKKFHGMIWLMWMLSTFPWIFVVFSALVKKVRQKQNLFALLKNDSFTTYFIMWSLFTMAFFTLSGNVLWTYNLPALPALAVLLALSLERSSFEIKIFSKNIAYGLLLFVPVVVFIANLYIVSVPNTLPTDKSLIQHYQQIKSKDAKIYYIYQRPFSAQYYSNDTAVLVSSAPKYKNKSLRISHEDFLKEILNHSPSVYLVAKKEHVPLLEKQFGSRLSEKYVNKQRVLFELKAN